MALIKCRECGKEISSEATSCPNCGAPVKEDEIKKEIKAGIKIGKKIAIIFIIALLLIIVVAFIFGYFIPSHTYVTKDSNGEYVEEFRLF